MRNCLLQTPFVLAGQVRHNRIAFIPTGDQKLLKLELISDTSVLLHSADPGVLFCEVRIGENQWYRGIIYRISLSARKQLEDTAWVIGTARGPALVVGDRRQMIAWYSGWAVTYPRLDMSNVDSFWWSQKLIPRGVDQQIKVRELVDPGHHLEWNDFDRLFLAQSILPYCHRTHVLVQASHYFTDVTVPLMWNFFDSYSGIGNVMGERYCDWEKRQRHVMGEGDSYKWYWQHVHEQLKWRVPPGVNPSNCTVDIRGILCNGAIAIDRKDGLLLHLTSQRYTNRMAYLTECLAACGEQEDKYRFLLHENILQAWDYSVFSKNDKFRHFFPRLREELSEIEVFLRWGRRCIFRRWPPGLAVQVLEYLPWYSACGPALSVEIRETFIAMEAKLSQCSKILARYS